MPEDYSEILLGPGGVYEEETLFEEAQVYGEKRAYEEKPYCKGTLQEDSAKPCAPSHLTQTR